MKLFLNLGAEEVVGVHKITIHKDYHFGDDDHDIAVMILSEKAKISNYIHPICLPTVNAALKQIEMRFKWYVHYCISLV